MTIWNTPPGPITVTAPRPERTAEAVLESAKAEEAAPSSCKVAQGLLRGLERRCDDSMHACCPATSQALEEVSGPFAEGVQGLKAWLEMEADPSRRIRTGLADECCPVWEWVRQWTFKESSQATFQRALGMDPVNILQFLERARDLRVLA